MANWTAQNIPDQSGRIAVITGANSGLGYESALALARKNAHVIMTARSASKGEAAKADILKLVPNATLTLMSLDLGSLKSVRAFADEFKAKFDRLDILMNNAGVMATPYGKTEDGFETQFGVNHLGHFALTALLIDVITQTPGSHIVSVSSTANYIPREVDFDNLNWEKDYSRYGAYGLSKLANVLFANELDRRLKAAGADTISNSAHPGLANTNLQTTTAATSGLALERMLYSIMMPLFSQSQEQGAWPQLYAATAPQAEGGKFYGPHFLNTRGYPTEKKANKLAYDKDIAARLWKASEALTGIPFSIAAVTTP